MLRALADDYRARLAGGTDSLDEGGPSVEEQADLAQRLRRTPQVAEALDRMWPRLSPHELLHDLLGARPAAGWPPGRASSTPTRYDASTDRAAAASTRCRGRWETPPSLTRRAPSSAPGGGAHGRTGRAPVAPRRGVPRKAGFWPQGLAASPVAGPRAPAPDHEEDVHSYGHIVVDEVQDLSPMQLRMLARRSLSGSMTVVGDIAQATGPWAPESWDDVTRHLSPQRATRLVELTVSYRTPAEVIAVAAQVLAVAAPGIAPPRPVRQSGFTPRIISASRTGLAAAVAQATREEVSVVAPGRVAVLGPAVMLPELARALSDAGLDPTDPRDPSGEGLAAGLVLLPADETNGLEFDAVVVVEPALVAAVGEEVTGESPPVATTRGLRTLYVALTRPTRRLAVVHADRCPLARCPACAQRGNEKRCHLLVGASRAPSTRNCAVTQAVSVDQPVPTGKIVHDRPPMLAVGVMIWLGSELMFFSGLFAAFFTIRADAPGGVWPPPGTHLDTIRGVIFTLVLVSSSFTHAVRRRPGGMAEAQVRPPLDRGDLHPRRGLPRPTRPPSGSSSPPGGTRTPTGRSSSS